MSEVVFLDRDGTINVDTGYLHEIEKFAFLPGVPGALKTLSDNEFDLVVVTNQSGVGRGYFSLSDVEELHEHMRKKLAEHGVELEAVFFCPHDPSEACECRKPKTGMIDDWPGSRDILQDSSYMIGDKPSDVGFGRKLGVNTILLDPDNDKEKTPRPDACVNDLPSAVDFILAEKET